MGLPRKSIANRANAQKSTGPRTRLGKEVSSRNAMQHGVLSRSLVLPSESKEEFEALLAELMADLQPEGTIEQLLVERITVAVWRQKRLAGAESAALQEAMCDQSPDMVNRVLKVAGLADKDQDFVRDILKCPMGSEAVAAELAQVRDCQEQAWELAAYPEKAPLVWSGLVAEAEVSPALAEQHQVQYVLQYLQLHFSGLAQYLEKINADWAFQLEVEQACELVRTASGLPQNSETLVRYQTALDNDWFKAMRTLRETQRYRLDRAALEARPINT